MTEKKSSVAIYPCVPEKWLWIPKPIRKALGWTYLVAFSLSFMSPLGGIVFLIPQAWIHFPILTSSWLSLYILSFTIPPKEWPFFRTLGQLWYELLDFSSNLSPDEMIARTIYARDHQLILAMHPHGIVPFQAILWSAFCDQYMRDPDSNETMYGFGAAADVVMFVPFLRNIMNFLSASSATYKALKDGLQEGKIACVNAAGRKPRHLYILPGGVAEIFCSTPGKHAIIFQDRKGLVKLSIETGAELVPCYVFGGTDFFHNLATGDGIFSQLSRKFRVGLTIFWGHFGLPIPFTPKVRLVMGKPIPIPKILPDDDERKSKTIDLLHQQYMTAMKQLFDEYKDVCGYSDAKLEIL